MSTQYTGTILSENPSPVAYYKLDEASGTVAHDTSVNAIADNGTISASGVTYGVSGAIVSDADTAMTFNGSSGSIALPSTINPVNFAGLTFEFWIKLSTLSLPTSPAIIANDVVPTSHNGVVVFINSTATAINFVLGNGSAATTCTGSFTFATATWYHIACTWDGATMTVYVNGVSKGTASFSGPLASTTNNLTIAHNPGGTDFFTGSIDEVSIYGFALTSTQLLNHYNIGIAKNTGIYYIPNNTKSRMVQPEDINQALNILNQPAGGQEIGHYFLEMPGYVVNATCSMYLCSLSRGATPVSVTVDAADFSNIGYTVSPPNTGSLTANGFQIFDFCVTGPQNNPRIGGNYTLNF